ncbi:RelA/SpoT domain-containing protein [Rhodonellum sp.]|uniref:RelA/SpoT domain-containing protein n=1 Tax=Rhodonellum sp. TaxID=2231180 RepID=UPI002721B1AB|nr:RelA/SpoT domain-containing protein [Rhodonellum sp.]MDO9553385.1 RelA/SpoT domain-containing protein [Rhodonellum sp.]
MEYKTFPGGSKTKVNKAGDSIKSDVVDFEQYAIVDEWREAHRAVLNTFQAILRTRTKGSGIIVAQRHKRRNTIIDKLFRFPDMELSRMDDVAGCRLIFSNTEDMYRFREKLHAARFSHRRKNDVDKYDYIKNPKRTGYRGIHDVYSYNVKSEVGKGLQGLLIEVQYRTLIQHAWATAVEIIGIITENQPKFERGDKRYERAMVLASEILSRTFENSTGPCPELNNKELVSEFISIDSEIHLIRTLKSLNAAPNTKITENKNSILIFRPDGSLEVKDYRDATDALKELFRLEKENPELDIVLVRADTSSEVRMAFKNYFTDAQDFIDSIETGCHELSGFGAPELP